MEFSQPLLPYKEPTSWSWLRESSAGSLKSQGVGSLYGNSVGVPKLAPIQGAELHEGNSGNGSAGSHSRSQLVWSSQSTTAPIQGALKGTPTWGIRERWLPSLKEPTYGSCCSLSSHTSELPFWELRLNNNSHTSEPQRFSEPTVQSTAPIQGANLRELREAPIQGALKGFQVAGAPILGANFMEFSST